MNFNNTFHINELITLLFLFQILCVMFYIKQENDIINDDLIINEMRLRKVNISFII